MPSLKLLVAELRDPADEARVRGVIGGRDGVYGMVVCLRTGTVAIDFEDDEISSDMLVDIVEQSGFDVKVIG